MTESTAVTKVAKPSFLERMLALAKTPEERERAFMLAERHAQSQLAQEITAELTAKSWGTNVGPALRLEAVRWALEVGADPTSELDILGGRPYLNANYWRRLVAAEPDFHHPEEVWVHHDPRASDEENEARKQLRIKYAVPDQIAATVGLFGESRKAAEKKEPVLVRAAVLVFLHFTERGPFLGKKWSPSRANDDVGMDYPESSALSRAWRKAALGAVRRKPPFSPKLTNVMVTGRLIDEATAKLPPLGETPVAQEPVTVQAIEPPRVGVIERHQPNAICGIEGEHRREDCGHFKGTKAGA